MRLGVGMYVLYVVELGTACCTARKGPLLDQVLQQSTLTVNVIGLR
jgi:hypothetical protein